MEKKDVRYERLRPRQIRAAREARPVAYVGIGTLEWHGMHNPVGLDTLKADALCVRCAEATGGLVLPPLWYGEARERCLIDSLDDYRDGCADAYGFDPKLLEPGHIGFPQPMEDENYQWLLVHMLQQMQSLGFKLGVICAGHYPLIDIARAAAIQFHQKNYHTPHDRRMIPWVFTGYELVKDQFPYAGDHAAYWETSLLMALDDDGIVDLSECPKDHRDPGHGVGGARPPQQASAEAGERYVTAIVERVAVEVDRRLADRMAYLPHGLVL